HRRVFDRGLPRTRDHCDLCDRYRRAAVSAFRSVRTAADMRFPKPMVIAAVGAGVLAILPVVAPSYYVVLMIPFFGYAIALLGFNLLFGYGGVLLFWHGVVLCFGVYCGALIDRLLGVGLVGLLAFGVVLGSTVVAVPIGLLCVRYVGIFFGMLTLAFGMLFHSFLFKFYHLTGGDSGMRIVRMKILGLDFADFNKIEFLAGPFYYYCLALLLVAGFLMWRIVHSPF